MKLHWLKYISTLSPLKITATNRQHTVGHICPMWGWQSLQDVCEHLLRHNSEQSGYTHEHIPKTVLVSLNRTKNGVPVCWSNNHHMDKCLLISSCSSSGNTVAISCKAQIYAHVLPLEKAYVFNISEFDLKNSFSCLLLSFPLPSVYAKSWWDH